jgi:hypothetical protein
MRYPYNYSKLKPSAPDTIRHSTIGTVRVVKRVAGPYIHFETGGFLKLEDFFKYWERNPNKRERALILYDILGV